MIKEQLRKIEKEAIRKQKDEDENPFMKAIDVLFTILFVIAACGLLGYIGIYTLIWMFQ